MIMKPTLRPMPQRMAELWDWVCAGAAFDGGDPEPLALLIAAGEVPPEFRRMIADVVSGSRRLPRKGKANAKIAPSERMQAAAAICSIRDLCDVLRTQAAGTRGGKPGADSLGNQLGREPKEIAEELRGEYRQATLDAASDLGVSTETIENIIRDLQCRIDRWPTV